VCQLANADEVLTDAEYPETRALAFELLGGRAAVKPRADGSAALALHLNLEPVIKACGSTSYNLVAGRDWLITDGDLLSNQRHDALHCRFTLTPEGGLLWPRTGDCSRGCSALRGCEALS
jgi:hypothetical protein